MGELLEISELSWMLRNQVVDTYRNMATMCYTSVSRTRHKKKKVGIVYRATASS